MNCYSAVPVCTNYVSAFSGIIAQKKETSFRLILRQIIFCLLLSTFYEIFSRARQQLAMAG